MTFQKGCVSLNKGKRGSEESKRKMSEAQKGKKLSDETKKKISLALKGRIVSEETREKSRQSNLGKHHTEETKKKISDHTVKKYRENNPTWKGGRVKFLGYIRIHNPKHPNANGQYVFEHRLIMEKYLGRYLYPWEIIHHINGIKDDNRIENLKLLPGIEHNTKVQKIYQENLQLKQRIAELELQLVS